MLLRGSKAVHGVQQGDGSAQWNDRKVTLAFGSVNIRHHNFDNVKYAIFTKLYLSIRLKKVHTRNKTDTGTGGYL